MPTTPRDENFIVSNVTMVVGANRTYDGNRIHINISTTPLHQQGTWSQTGE